MVTGAVPESVLVTTTVSGGRSVSVETRSVATIVTVTSIVSIAAAVLFMTVVKKTKFETAK